MFNKLKTMLLSVMDENKRGNSNAGVYGLIGVVILAVILGALAPTILSSLFNISTSGTGIPTWVPLVLGILGVAALINILLKAGKGGR